MPTQAEKAAQFQALHQRPEIFVIANPWDAGTARILTTLGFSALTTTSAGLAFTLGKRDGSVTRDEALANARTIADATHLPVAAAITAFLHAAREVKDHGIFTFTTETFYMSELADLFE